MKMEQPEKEYAGEYEITQSVTLGKKRFVIGRCDEKAEPYLIANHRTKFDRMFAEYYDVGVSSDYMEIMAAFIQRQKDELDVILQQRKERGSDGIPFGSEDCQMASLPESLVGQIAVLNAVALAPEYRVKEEQLIYVLGGFGAEKNSRGGKVFCRDCYTGERYYVRREDLLGVIRADRLPEWARVQVERFKRETWEKETRQKQQREER